MLPRVKWNSERLKNLPKATQTSNEEEQHLKQNIKHHFQVLFPTVAVLSLIALITKAFQKQCVLDVKYSNQDTKKGFE
jgi:hypothetical protein